MNSVLTIRKTPLKRRKRMMSDNGSRYLQNAKKIQNSEVVQMIIAREIATSMNAGMDELSRGLVLSIMEEIYK